MRRNRLRARLIGWLAAAAIGISSVPATAIAHAGHERHEGGGGGLPVAAILLALGIATLSGAIVVGRASEETTREQAGIVGLLGATLVAGALVVTLI